MKLDSYLHNSVLVFITILVSLGIYTLYQNIPLISSLFKDFVFITILLVLLGFVHVQVPCLCHKMTIYILAILLVLLYSIHMGWIMNPFTWFLKSSEGMANVNMVPLYVPGTENVLTGSPSCTIDISKKTRYNPVGVCQMDQSELDFAPFSNDNKEDDNISTDSISSENLDNKIENFSTNINEIQEDNDKKLKKSLNLL